MLVRLYQQLTVSAVSGIFAARSGVMADSRKRPHVVHGPYHRLAGIDDAADVIQRKHPLIDPMEVDYIRLTELRQRTDVCTGIGDVYGKEVFPGESVGRPDYDTFPCKLPDSVLQSLHQAVGRDGRPSDSFCRVDDKYSHGSGFCNVYAKLEVFFEPEHGECRKLIGCHGYPDKSVGNVRADLSEILKCNLFMFRFKFIENNNGVVIFVHGFQFHGYSSVVILVINISSFVLGCKQAPRFLFVKV